MIISWDEYFMGVAIFSAYRSKDPHTQVGACIVNEDKHIVGVGYNGMPNGCDDSVYPWGRTGDFADQKYPYVVHAELNADPQRKHVAQGLPHLRLALPLQRVLQGDHPERHPRGRLSRGQVRGDRQHEGVQAYARLGRRHLPPHGD